MSGLRIVWLDEAAADRMEAAPPADLLALVRFGGAAQSHAPPHVSRLPLPHLEGVAAEAWFGSGTVRREIRGAVVAGDDGNHLFATLDTGGATEDLEESVHRSYRELLREAGGRGYPHLLRAWNTVSSINGVAKGQERYRLFCKGRAEAYAAVWGPRFETRLPASSAVGSHEGGVTVQVLAGRRPGRSIENPRQVSAYRYPDAYGPRSPSFARGLVAPAGSGGWIFVSGTASIVGHESVHRGKPVAQTEETMRNIEQVLDESGCSGAGGTLGSRLHGLRVYLRRREDLGAIRATLARCLGSPSPTVWLLADVCREELLVEIEAIAPGQGL